jgi:hypothetical protein
VYTVEVFPPRRRHESANDHAMFGRTPKIVMSSADEEVVIMPDVVGSSSGHEDFDG